MGGGGTEEPGVSLSDGEVGAHGGAGLPAAAMMAARGSLSSEDVVQCGLWDIE